MTSGTIEELKRRGHTIGQVGMSNEGTILISVDWKLLTYPEIDAILEKELNASAK
jgi:hypothetical protein